MLTRHAWNTLTRALAATLILSTLIHAAPAGVSTAADEGLPTATTLEISTDLAKHLASGYATTDAMYNATKVDTEGEFAPTVELPMTSEEIALAKMAAVVAELASTTADEMKVKTTVEEEDKLVRRRVVAAKRRAIEREIANTVEAGEGEQIDEKDFLAITTYRTNFLNAIGVTVAPTTTPAAATSIATATTTNLAPEILNELVRAAAAANEILSAALNVATTAIANLTASEATTTSYVMMEEAKTTAEPIATQNSAGDASVDDPTLTVMTDSDALPEQSAKWQLNKVVLTSTPRETTTDIKLDTSDTAADTTKLGTTTQTTEIGTSIRNEANRDDFWTKPLASEYSTAAVTKLDQKEIPTVGTTSAMNQDVTVNPKVLEGFHSPSGVELAASINTLKPLDDVEPIDHEVENEAAESMQIITIETTTAAASPASVDNEVESETFNFYYASSTGAQKQMTTTSPYKDETNAIEKEALEIAKNIVLDTTTSASLAKENGKEAVEIEEAEVQELKLEAIHESEQKVRDHASIATNANSVIALETTPSTTEPLETLIAVESEARAPNKILINAEKENKRKVELAPFTTAMPAIKVAMETVTEEPQQEVVTEKLSNNSTITKISTSLVGEITTETLINPELTVTLNTGSIADITATELPEVKMELEITTAESEKTSAYNVVNEKPERAADPGTSFTISTTTEARRTTENMEINTGLPILVNGTLEEKFDIIPIQFETEPTVAKTNAADLTSSDKGSSESENVTDAVTEVSDAPATTLPVVEITSAESTTPATPESFAITTNQDQIIATREPVTDATTTNDVEQATALDFTSSVIKVPLAPFTTTTINPTISEEFSQAQFTTTQSEGAATANNESMQTGPTKNISSDRTTKTADNTLPTTLNSKSETTNTPAANELATIQTNNGDRIIFVTTTSNEVVAATTPVIEALAMETELSVISTTTPKADIIADTLNREQPLYMRSRYEQQHQQDPNISELSSTLDTVLSVVEAATTATSVELPVEGEKETETEATTDAAVMEQYFYKRILNEQQQAFEFAGSTKAGEEQTKEMTTDAATESTELTTSTEATSTTTTTSEPDTTTTSTTPQPETTTTTTTPVPESTTTTTPELDTTTITTTAAAEPETTTTTTTTTHSPDTTTTTTTTAEPETTTSTTTTTTTAEPETTTTTTTTTPAPDTTTTTTTTAEPETTTSTTTTTTTAEPETTTTTTTTTPAPDTTTTTTTTAEPETTTSTTTTTTTAEPETTTTTTTTPEPETTTTTTTLSPMSLIIAEHEARSLDKTPSRVSRFVNDDGVEVLSGYSIVHLMHAAAAAALEAMQGA